MCLTTALSHGSIRNDSGCLPANGEAVSHGHQFANTAPGVSVLAVPMANLIGLTEPTNGQSRDLRLWAVRISSVGIGLLVCAFLLGRVAEGLAPGWGGATLVTFSLGTICSAVAPTIFDHMPAAALSFGAFLLAWSRRPFWAGLAMGLALTVEYQAALIAVVLAGYALCTGLRPLGRYLLGAVPGALLIGAYDWSAFGSPFATSYGSTPGQPQTGYVGVGLPSLHGAHLLLVGDRGLLVDSPVLVAAAFGLVLLRRRVPLEALVCGIVTVLFLLLDAGYALPYGGDSPGPRFVATALPFAAVGLAPAFARLPVLTSVLAGASLIASTAVALTWPTAVNTTHGFGDTVWYYLAQFVHHGAGSAIATWIQPTLFDHLGAGPIEAAAVIFGLAALALGLAVHDGWATRAPSRPVRAPGEEPLGA
jgi:hypothetical protein